MDSGSAAYHNQPAMAMWLLKTEPEDYDFARLVRDKKTVWDGVENNQALLHMRKARKGDRALIYHTGDEKAAVGLATLISDPYPDPKDPAGKLVVFDVKPEKALKEPVTLKAVKAEAAFASFDLVRNSRLSVMPVSEAYWKKIMAMAGEK